MVYLTIFLGSQTLPTQILGMDRPVTINIRWQHDVLYIYIYIYMYFLSKFSWELKSYFFFSKFKTKK